MHVGGGDNNHNNEKSGGQRGLEKRDSSFSVFVAQGYELRTPITLRVVENVERPEEKLLFVQK